MKEMGRVIHDKLYTMSGVSDSFPLVKVVTGSSITIIFYRIVSNKIQLPMGEGFFSDLIKLMILRRAIFPVVDIRAQFCDSNEEVAMEFDLHQLQYLVDYDTGNMREGDYYEES